MVLYRIRYNQIVTLFIILRDANLLGFCFGSKAGKNYSMRVFKKVFNNLQTHMKSKKKYLKNFHLSRMLMYIIESQN